MKSTDYRSLYIDNERDLFMYAFRLCRDKALAKDIVHDVFVKLIEKSGSTLSIRNWKAYLFITVRNETLRYLKKQMAERRMLEEQVYYHAAYYTPDTLLEKQYHADFREIITQLPTQQGVVYKLHCVHNLPYREVAFEMGLAPATIKHHLKEVRRKLRKIVA